jgi:hypothetical protein
MPCPRNGGVAIILEERMMVWNSFANSVFSGEFLMFTHSGDKRIVENGVFIACTYTHSMKAAQSAIIMIINLLF